MMLTSRRYELYPLRLRLTRRRWRLFSEQREYERKTPREHVLLRPGMYLGQVNPITASTWVYNRKEERMEKQMLTYSPALVKIFDEILVNAADNRLRSSDMSKIDIKINYSKKTPLTISVQNDGATIPIAFDSTENMYIPELIFGHLLTSSNFNDSIKKVTGGRHGYGAKLTNIFSSSFEVEIRDATRKKVFNQKWENNMTHSSVPSITDINETDAEKNNKSYTKITFIPDTKLFSTYYSIPRRKKDITLDYASLEDTEKVLLRRIIDISATVSPIKISYNGKRIGVDSLKEYIGLFLKNPPQIESESDSLRNTVKVKTVNRRWIVGLIPSPSGSFEHMSFVNGVWTVNGGTHINYLSSQCVKYVEDAMKKKYQLENIPVSATIKNKFMLFVQCLIENPSFDSQSKDALITKVDEFGSKCTLPKSFLKECLENEDGFNIVKNIYDSARARERSRVLTPEKGSFGKKSIHVPKLEDAHAAGTKDALQCTLILTEGESAKALARAGLEIVGRKYYGILSLQGKILNVLNSSKTSLENKELLNFSHAMGFNLNKTYEDSILNQGLRYGHVLIMTDQDIDGSHIKGLVVNFIGKFWPHLLRHKDFIQQFHTPLLKIFNVPIDDAAAKERKAGQSKTLEFFSAPEYDEWRKNFIDKNGLNAWQKLRIKYYKGLGTSTSEEGKGYFSNLDKHVKSFVFGDDTLDALTLAFSKDRVNDRKNWLKESYDKEAFIAPSKREVTFEEFINVELIQFSHSDLVRSLPSVVDGLKPSQRKVLHSCFKRNLVNELKVAQLGGSVAEISGYHHGEQSLTSTIVRMAQDFPGANNIPLLHPSGQFGTRHEGGKDFASPRYIFTHLSKLTRLIFPQVDDEILQYQEEDGKTIEPNYFLPIIPFILVNGSSGIGTGWSTSIPPFHPVDLILHLRDKLHGKATAKKLIPWVKGFTGEIRESCDPAKGTSGYKTYGCVKRTSKTVVEIFELPCYKWTNQYKEFLHKLFSKRESDLISMKEQHAADGVRFIVEGKRDFWDGIESSEGGFIEFFKLYSAMTLDNMHGFDASMALQHYRAPEDIVDAYMSVRLRGYNDRKSLQCETIKRKKEVVSNKARFISAIISEEIPMMGKPGKALSDSDLLYLLQSKGFKSLNEIDYSETYTERENVSNTGGYSYLLNMPISSLTAERMASLNRKVVELDNDLEILISKTPEDMWLEDLDKLEAEIMKYDFYKR